METIETRKPFTPFTPLSQSPIMGELMLNRLAADDSEEGSE